MAVPAASGASKEAPRGQQTTSVDTHPPILSDLIEGRLSSAGVLS